MRTPASGELPDRQTLYEQVWTKPVSHLATEYDVKYWDVQNWCKQLNIPMPDRGYWTRLRHGHREQRPPLPAGPKSAGIDDGVKFSMEGALSFKVPDRLKDPDPITLAAKAGLEMQRQDRHFVFTEDGQFPIRVAKANVNRALRILDTLVKCWKRRGYRIELHDRQAFIWLREVRQRISMWEIAKADRKTKPGESKKMLPTGKLALRMDWWGGRDWRDGAAPLEDQIQNILDHMEKSARQLEREREQPPAVPATTVTIVAKEAGEAIPELLKDNVSSIGSLEALVAEAKLWKELKVVDDYLTALELSVPHSPSFVEWLDNAKKLRKDNDPLIKRLLP